MLDLRNNTDTLRRTNRALNLLLMHYVCNAYVTRSIISSGMCVSLSLSSFIHGYRRYPRVSTRAYARKLKLSHYKHHCITGNYDSARNIVSCLTGRYRTGAHNRDAIRSFAFHRWNNTSGRGHRRIRHLRVTQLRSQEIEFVSPGIKWCWLLCELIYKGEKSL